MKKIVFAVLLVLTGFAFGQQALWSTMENNDTAKNIKYIPYDSVTKEVLEFYDLYNFYFDFTGFNKEKLKETYLKYSSRDKKDLKEDLKEDLNWINDIKERVVFALRTPIEGGSAIMVVCIDKNNFHTIVFSNVYDSGANITYGDIEKERKRFEKWFKTLLN
jgi:hypothetical protein